MQPGDGGPAAGCGRDPAGGCDALWPASPGIRGTAQDSLGQAHGLQGVRNPRCRPVRLDAAVADVAAGVAVATTFRCGRPDQATATVLHGSRPCSGAIFPVWSRTFQVGSSPALTWSGTSRSGLQLPRPDLENFRPGIRVFRPGKQHSRPEIRRVRPGHELPGRVTNFPGRGRKISGLDSHGPDLKPAGPDLKTSLPDRGTSCPDRESASPDQDS